MKKEYDKKLSRLGRSRNAVECHLDGNFLFRSHKYYKDQGIDTEEEVGDYEYNGIVNRDVCKDYPNQPAFFMSFSETIPGSLTGDRNKETRSVLGLTDPEGFSELIQQNLLSPNFVKVEWIPMKYGKLKKVDRELGPVETFHRKYRCKTEGYRNECEWRLQIQILHSFGILNDNLRLYLGLNAGGFFEITCP